MATNKPIGTLGTIDSITVGGRVLTDLASADLITLTGRGSNANRSACRKFLTSSGYTPSGSKTFVVASILAWTDGTSASNVAIGYADNDVGFNSNTSPTNPVWIGGTSTESTSGIPAGTLASPTGVPMGNFTVPNGKYLLLGLAGAAVNTNIIVYGYEV